MKSSRQHSPLALLLLGFISFYRLVFSPWVGRYCRFEPTCSRYTETAISEYGALKGLFMGMKRIARCHPWCEAGYDPVPTHPSSDDNKA